METENTHKEYQRRFEALEATMEALAGNAPSGASISAANEMLERIEALEGSRAIGDFYSLEERVTALEDKVHVKAVIGSVDEPPKQCDSVVLCFEPGKWWNVADTWKTNGRTYWRLNAHQGDDVHTVTHKPEEPWPFAEHAPVDALVTHWEMGTAKPKNTPPTIPVEDLVTAWADRKMLDALEAQGADEDARTSIMEEMVSKEALRDCLGDAFLGWAKELVSEYKPPAKPDKERVQGIAFKLMDNNSIAEEIAVRMEGRPSDSQLRDHWHCVAKAGIDAAAKVFQQNHIMIEMWNEAADRTSFAKRTPSMREFNPSGARMQECLGYVMELAAPPTEAQAVKTLDEDCGPAYADEWLVHLGPGKCREDFAGDGERRVSGHWR